MSQVSINPAYPDAVPGGRKPLEGVFRGKCLACGLKKAIIVPLGARFKVGDYFPSGPDWTMNRCNRCGRVNTIQIYQTPYCTDAQKEPPVGFWCDKIKNT